LLSLLVVVIARWCMLLEGREESVGMVAGHRGTWLVVARNAGRIKLIAHLDGAVVLVGLLLWMLRFR